MRPLQIEAILTDESTHVSFLDGLIKANGADPLGAQCSFDFTDALKDVSTMITTARILELVGVGAYEGGAILVTDKDVLGGAGAILGIEARHASLLNTFDRGDFSPSALRVLEAIQCLSEGRADTDLLILCSLSFSEIGLSPESVLSLAAPFVKGGCDLSILGLVRASPFFVSPSLSPFPSQLTQICIPYR